MKDFKDYLMEKHGKQYVGTDDCMPDDFEDWLADLDVEDLIVWADEYSRKQFADGVLQGQRTTAQAIAMTQDAMFGKKG